MDPAEKALHLALAECEDCSRHELRTLLQTREAMRRGVSDEEAAAVEAILPDVDRAIALLSRTLATATSQPLRERLEVMTAALDAVRELIGGDNPRVI
jgi:hypothetical protein